MKFGKRLIQSLWYQNNNNKYDFVMQDYFEQNMKFFICSWDHYTFFFKKNENFYKKMSLKITYIKINEFQYLWAPKWN